MISGLYALLVASSLGQSPEAGWLKAIPGDVDVAVRCRGIESTEKDLMAMLQAMSPMLANQAQASLEQGMGQVRDRLGQAGAESPVLAVAEFPGAGGGGMPSVVILIASDDYERTLKALAGDGGKADPKAQPGGYDTIVDKDGTTLYTLKGDGYVAFSPVNDTLLKTMVKPEGRTLDARLSPEIREQLFGGDLGVYSNIGDLQEKYADQIQAARQQLMAALDQAGAQMKNNQMEMTKQIYSRMFDSIKSGDALAMHVDFGARGLGLSGLVSVKPGSDAARALKTAKVGDAALLGKLPAGLLAYVYMNVDPKMIEYFQSMNFGAMDPDFKESPEYKAAMENLRSVGHQESFGGMSLLGGMNGITISRPEHPEKMLEGTKQMLEATRSSKFVKDMEITPKAETYKGIDFTRSVVTFDLDKLVGQQGGNPGGEAVMKSMFTDGMLRTWTGISDKLAYSIMAPSWDEAKKKLDAVLGDAEGIGQTEGFKAVRSQLPDQVRGLVMMQSQSFVGMMGEFFSSIGNADVKPPADLPVAPAFFGGSYTVSPAGYRFDFVMPSANGPVFEKGLVPLFQAVLGKVNH